MDSVSFFTSIKFGSKIPDPLIACANATGADYPRLRDLHLTINQLSPHCRSTYPDLSSFLSVPVSFVTIFTNQQKQVLAINLYVSFSKDTGSAQSAKPLLLYKQLVERMTTLYEKPSQTEAGDGMDTAVLRQWGQEIPVKAAWNGDHVSVIIHAIYNSKSGQNGLAVEIRDQNVEEPPGQEMTPD